MRVLMFGWEFPPHNSGGLGVACKGIVTGLAQEGVDVIFVLPQLMDTGDALKDVRFADPKTLLTGDAASLYDPYLGPVRWRAVKFLKGGKIIPGSSLLDRVAWYAMRAAEIAKQEDFDVIHAHDWLTYPAGLAAQEMSGKPLIVHVHATEFDRTGNGEPNREVFAIEKSGMEAADQVICVSEFTRQAVIANYGIDPAKVTVVHNAGEPPVAPTDAPFCIAELKAQEKKTVLFVGRLTLQKGPDWFVKVARRVANERPDVRFVVAGTGDMESQMRHEVHAAGLEGKFTFAGFLRDGQLAAAYRLADVFIMPSVSEPFGLTALEAMSHGVPSVLSRQSGVAEVVRHCFKSDFWDVDAIASRILAILNYPALKATLAQEAPRDALRSGWRDTGRKLKNLYVSVIDRCKAVLK